MSAVESRLDPYAEGSQLGAIPASAKWPKVGCITARLASVGRALTGFRRADGRV